MLVVDLGDFCGVETKAYGYDTEIMLDIMKLSGYGVATVGEFDLKRGVNYVRKAGERGGFDIVCANVEVKGQGKVRPFAPYVIKKVGSRRFGVIGVIGKDDPGSGNRGVVTVDKNTLDANQIVVTDPLVAIKEILPEVKKRSDVVVVLAHTGLPRAREIMQLIPEVDVVLPGHAGLNPVKSEGMGPVLGSGTQRSDRLGVLRLVTDGGKIVEAGGETIALNQDNHPWNAAVREIVWTKLELDEKGNRKPPTAVTQRDTTKAATETTIADVANDTAPRIFMKGDHYLGVGACKDCHVQQWAQWSGTKHARAYETLAASENEDWNNHQCLPCHVTGYGEAGGHATAGLSPEFWNVQCEECHGMGTRHAIGAGLEVTQASCLNCHTEDQDPDFDFARDLIGMIH